MDEKKKAAIEDLIKTEFSPIPHSIMYGYLSSPEYDESLENITALRIGSEIHLSDRGSEVFEVLSYDSEIGLYTVKDENDKEFEISIDEVDRDWVGHDLPKGHLWLLKQDSFLANRVWDMSQSGFTVYRMEKDNYLLVGVDREYGFIKENWEPLYDKLGLKWHEFERTVSTSKAVELASSLGAKPDKIAKALDISKETVKQYVPQSVR